jgi:DNA helicase-2/ATP-dependent DNA helicase PcrA
VPLAETVSEVLGVGPSSKRVRREVERLLDALGPELFILREAPLEDLQGIGGSPLAEAIRRIRAEDLAIAAGFDGQFGKVQIFEPGELEQLHGQLAFLDAPATRSDETTSPGASPTIQKSTKNTESEREDDNLLAPLNRRQRQATNSLTGPLLVVAGPGTGKTLTLAARILSQIRNGAARADEVLALTFTRQAQEELETRIAGSLGDDSESRPMVSTFHGLGLRILEELEEKEIRILEPEDRRELLQSAMGRKISRRDADRLLARFSLAKQGMDPGAALSSDPEVSRIFRRYESARYESQSVDVDDLVLLPYRRLSENSHAASHWSSRFKSISVDEYQDVNDVQAALLSLLSPQAENLFVIGDPNQAIYGFRGSRPGHFQRFSATYPSCRTISLDVTYRLTHPILGAASALLEDRDPLSALKDGPRVEIVSCPSAPAEAEQIVVRLEQILGGTSTFAVDSDRGRDAELQGVGFGDVAVLCRTRAQRREVLEALARSGLPALPVGEDEPHHPASQKIAVMTLHAAKGREFEVVFIPGVEEGILPLKRDGRTTDIAEERRLLYVGMTRGRQLVVLSYAARRRLWGSRLPGRPSPFLESFSSRWIVRRNAGRSASPGHRGQQLDLF